MALVGCRQLRIAFGGPLLLDDAGFQLERGERVGLLGRNGEGKSTLLKIVAGELRPDAGEVALSSGIRVSRVGQELPEEVTGTTLQVVASGGDRTDTEEHQAARLCSLFHLDPAQPFATLSGGQKRRALLGRALVSDPDVLLLDEPTNHLDLDHIAQLESMLQRFEGSILFVTHDRAFLQRVATRILELDRGQLTSWACDYATYLQRRDDLLASEEKEWANLDRKLAQEEAWIRRGIKARRTRNEGRVRALQQLRAERAARRERMGQVRFAMAEAERTTAKVVEARDVTFGYEEEAPVVRDFSALIQRGDKVGVIGPNGCGKTTLLNLLLGRLTPDQGSVRHGARLDIAWFDQLREQLDPDATVAWSVSGGNDFVAIGEERRHIYAYLRDFLFSEERARQPVSSLSGGERSRLLLARLFTRPANVLVLDEPTNDLDTETLELLEARLVEYMGTVLVVSHDRAFLDNLCTSSIVFEGNGRFREYVGGYSDWQRVARRREDERAATAASSRKSGGRASTPAAPGAHTGAAAEGPPDPGTTPPDTRRRLSFRERQEWNELPGQIEALEQELHEIEQRLSDPAFFQADPEAIRTTTQRAREIPEEIERAFERWAELDARA
jgi:ATP-binding cassette subfamily F protein uup